MILKNYEIVLFSGDFIEFITPIVTVLAVFLTYYLAKKEFKFRNYYERRIEVLCELYGMLEELKFLLRKTVMHSDEEIMFSNLRQSNDVYQKFNLYKRKKSIFIDSDLYSDIKKFEDEWLVTYAKITGAYREKKSTGNQGWGKQYHEALNNILGENLENILIKINVVVKNYLK
ncbi:MAG: hypothetical protein V1704_00610 [Candidatus Vogelbacteria bacterium]